MLRTLDRANTRILWTVSVLIAASVLLQMVQVPTGPSPEVQQAQGPLNSQSRAYRTASEGPPRPSGTPTGVCANATDDQTFRSDFAVNFSPYQINLAGQSPIVNVSQFANREAFNVSVTQAAKAAGITMIQVLLTVWSTWWNSTNSTTSPNAPTIWNLPISNGTWAIGVLIDDKYFPPGSTVFFNLTIVAAPSYDEIDSPCPVGPDPTWSQVGAQPTWMYMVSGGWPSPIFSNDITLDAFPDIFQGVYPDSYQPVDITMTSVGGKSVPIAGADIYYNVTDTNISTGATTTQESGALFTPTNSSSASVNLGPFGSPGNRTTVQFYIGAWAIWDDVAVNFIRSLSYGYAVTGGGTWCGTDEPFTSYVNIGASVNYVTLSSFTTQSITSVPPYSVVNITAETVSADTIMSYADIFFNETFRNTTVTGNLIMTRFNATTVYSESNSPGTSSPAIGPFLPGVSVAFSVKTFDSMKCAISSLTYTLRADTGPSPGGPPPPLACVYDSPNQTPVSGVLVQFNNSTWWSNSTTDAFGCAYPTIDGTALLAFLNLNQYYTVTVTHEGQTQSINYFYSLSSNGTLTFEFGSAKPAESPQPCSLFGFTEDTWIALSTAAGVVFALAMLVALRGRRSKGGTETSAASKNQDRDVAGTLSMYSLGTPPPGHTWVITERTPEPPKEKAPDSSGTKR